MTPATFNPAAAARVSRAARLVASVTPHVSAEAVLRRELAPRRDLAPDERREMARAVAVYFRWQRWLDQRAALSHQIEAALILQARFDARPAAIKPEALATRAVPEWIWTELPLPEAGPTEMPPQTRWLRQLQRDPPLWIRARREFAEALPRKLGDCEPAAREILSPGFRVLGHGASTQNPELKTQNPICTAFRYTGSQDLFLADAFQQGWFEIQDLASQLVGHACAPHAGETWWDACAGEGGKLLHLADLMQNRGLIWASDRSVRRLHVLRQRAARAGVFNYRAVCWNGGPRPPTRTRFDGILVDAPCSGVGTWQRHPDARWTTSPADVRELAIVQRQLLEHAAGSLKPGGRLVYAVCTLTRTETVDVAERFSAAHPEFEPAPAFPEVGTQRSEVGSQRSEGSLQSLVPSDQTRQVPRPRPLTSDHRPSTSVLLWPYQINANGMFIAAWRRTC